MSRGADPLSSLAWNLLRELEKDLTPGVNDFLDGDICERKFLTVAYRAPVLRSRSVPMTTKVDAVKKRRPNWRPFRWKLLLGKF